MQFRILYFVCCMLLMATSCVSKKKYVEMTSSRDRAQSRVRTLTSDIKGLEEEYNRFQNELHQANEQKNLKIDSITQSMVSLASSVETQSDDISSKLLSFKIEEQRLNRMILEKSNELKRSKARVDVLTSQNKQISDMLTEVRFSLKKAESESKSLNTRLDATMAKVDESKESEQVLRREIDTLKASITQKDAEIERLSNTVKLLKSQLKN